MLPHYKDGIYGFKNEFRFLSNFWPSDVVFDRVTYPTVEHAYQASKTFNLDSRKVILACKSPGTAKRAGRLIKIRSDWEKVKVGLMKDFLTQKFSNVDLALLLLKTEQLYLEETNAWGDTFWGVCNGKGKNILGNLLMDIRTNLQNK